MNQLLFSDRIKKESSGFMRIGVFDSGIGGLTVLKKIREAYPNNDYIYYGDNKNVPYGNKTKEQLITLGKNCIQFLKEKNVDFIIVACGTLSSNCTKELKEEFPNLSNITDSTFKFFNESSYQKIGVLATPATISTHVFKTHLKNNVIEVSCPLFAEYIEKGLINNEEFQRAMESYLEPLKDVDAIILGCTHYPFIENEISEFYNNKIPIFNMADFILPIIKENQGNSSVQIYFSDPKKELIEFAYQFLNIE